MHENNCFVTLTYNQENLPEDWSLNYRDYQLFMKRLRKYTKQKIRFYMCGEYGEENFRPHYHAILFGYMPDDLEVIGCNHMNQKLYKSPFLEKTWGKGFVTIGEVTFQSAAYVARYCMKKITGEEAEEHYKRVIPDTGEIVQVKPEFSCMSRKPGIGKPWFDKYMSDVFPHDYCVNADGKKVKTPNYYLDLLEKEAPFLWEEVKHNRLLSLDKHLDEQSEERLLAREKCQEARLNKLIRRI
jgi:hypothetical protein